MQILFILYSALGIFLQTDANLEMRTEYHLAINDENKAREFCSKMGSITQPNPLQLGYLGAGKMVLAKYEYLPLQKYQLFTQGRALLEKAIQDNQSETELRYLRYGIQINCPSFLNYNRNLIEDKKYLLQHTASLTDKDLKKRIITFLTLYGSLNDAERKLLQ